MYINRKWLMLGSLFAFLLLINTEANAQSSKLSVRWSGGVSYLPLGSLRQYYEGVSTEDIHFTVRPSAAMAFSVGMRYGFSLHHGISVNIKYLESRSKMQVVFTRPVQTYIEIPDVLYNIQAVPLTFGYQYTFDRACFTPFVGVGISYIFTSIDKRPDYTSDIKRDQSRQEFSKNTFVSEVSIGVMKPVMKKWDTYSQISYMYSPRLILQNESLDLAGFSLAIGLRYNIGSVTP